MPIDHESVKMYEPTINKVIGLILEQKRPIDQADMVERFTSKLANRLILGSERIVDKDLSHLVQIFAGVIESKYRLHHFQHFLIADEFNHILSRIVLGVLGKVDLKQDEYYGFNSYLRQRLLEADLVQLGNNDPYRHKAVTMARGVIGDIVRETQWIT
jgi:hypothetical protein